MSGSIVVSVDGSDLCHRALEEAASLAVTSDRSVLAVFVRRVPFVSFYADVVGCEASAAVGDALGAMQCLAEAQCVAILESASVCWQFQVRTGEPARQLMRIAAEVNSDVIVIAGGRVRSFCALMPTSVVRRLIRKWPHSLLVIEPTSDAAISISKGEILHANKSRFSRRVIAR